MGRYTFPAFKNALTPRYLAVWDLQWRLIDCRRLEPAADLSGAMTAAIECLEADGWSPEATLEYGFVFICRGTERRLLMLTPGIRTAPRSKRSRLSVRDFQSRCA